MKYFIITLLLSWAISAAGQGVAAPERIALKDGWTFAEEGKGEWRTAEVPGTVHGDLLRHGLLPDPFYGKNEEKIQWVEEHDWHYRTTFTLTREQAERTGADLVFEGLDTYADVYLNGALVLRGDNMFVGYRIPVKEVLQEGENRLYIVFHSPIRTTLPQWETNGFEYPADNDHAERRVSVFSRKAPYSYGWDWGGGTAGTVRRGCHHGLLRAAGERGRRAGDGEQRIGDYTPGRKIGKSRGRGRSGGAIQHRRQDDRKRAAANNPQAGQERGGD